jgi:uncharacterized protein DUF6894
MPRYFFNIVDPDGTIPDTEGSELPDIDAVREEALASAREMIAETIKNGGKVDGRSFRIEDITGAVDLTLAFKDAVS